MKTKKKTPTQKRKTTTETSEVSPTQDEAAKRWKVTGRAGGFGAVYLDQSRLRFIVEGFFCGWWKDTGKGASSDIEKAHLYTLEELLKSKFVEKAIREATPGSRPWRPSWRLSETPSQA